MAKPHLLLLIGLAACTTPPPPAAPPAPPPTAAAPEPSTDPSVEIERRAAADRMRILQLELERLRADLRAAEETLLSVESGMRGAQGRAGALSALAEARIQVDRAARSAPWRADAAAEAREKLVEAERQLAENRVGSAYFFVSRARRIAESLAVEAERVASDPDTQFVSADRVNLRDGPTQQARVVATMRAQLPVFVEGREGDWSLVRTATGEVGFVRSDLLTKP